MSWKLRDASQEQAETVAQKAGVSAAAIKQMRLEFHGVRKRKPREAMKLDTEE